MNRMTTLATLAAAGMVLTACSSSAETATEASVSASAAPTCDAATLATLEPGTLTIATGQPAYEPWVVDDAPESGEGFEAAVAMAAAPMPTPMRASFIIWNIYLNPLWGSPTSHPRQSFLSPILSCTIGHPR